MAYLGVIVIWSTTPLAIQWSSDGPGFLFSVAARMGIGALAAVLALRVLGVSLPWTREARRTYLVAGLGIYAAMTCVYWAAGRMPSGWISVVFGLSPMMTGLLARIWLGERAFAAHKLSGMVLGVAGLGLVFAVGRDLGEGAVLGIGAVLLSALAHSASGIGVKRIGAPIPGLAVTAGALLVATPLFVATWWLFDGAWPVALPPRALGGIVYLGMVGSVVGFAMYYYVLRHLEASRVALIALVTPIVALVLGYGLNGEPLTVRIGLGAALVLLGLASYELGDGLGSTPAQRLWARSE
jgi:drug/metabolite transporter (DMT)-like permease